MTKGHKNLTPLDKRPEDERREIARKGGIASGEARRKKANIKRTLETLLKMDVPAGKLKQQLESMGIDPSLEQGLVLSVLLTTIKTGSMSDLKTLQSMLQQTASPADRREQKARTERIQAEAKRVETELAIKTGEDGQGLASIQKQAIADLINTPESERVLQDFLRPKAEEVKHAADTNDNTSSEA